MDGDGVEKEWTVPYSCTVSDLCNRANLPPGTALYNIHNKELPRNLPLRGRVILKMNIDNVTDESDGNISGHG